MINIFYIAGKFTAQSRLRDVRTSLRAAGVEVSSTWLDEVDTDANVAAKIDLEEVNACSVFILDTLDETATGGREVELGLAMACGVRILLVGPKRNVFHGLIREQYDTWDDLLTALIHADQ